MAEGKQSDSKAVASIWEWLFARQDVSLGPNRRYNHLTLDEVLSRGAAADAHSGEQRHDVDVSTADASDASSKQQGPKVSLSFPRDMTAVLTPETMWECLTGHGVDFTRVPKSEWELIQGIASARENGILQGDLCRLTGQDKRSVPKRTDGLVRKGYITKRTVLVRGTKTSKIWLNRFVPQFIEQKERKQHHSTAGMNLDTQFLISNRDPVPWHHRWTGDTMDYVALATTTLAIIKSWGVIRTPDLKMKLGVMGLRWQMKVTAKTLRFMHTRGCAQFVGAVLDEKLFKDCLKFVRPMDDSDWEAYLAVGKKGSTEALVETGPGMEDSNMDVNTALLSTLPAWSIDEPIQTYLTRTVRSLNGSHVTNMDACSLTAGTSFTRFVTVLLATMAESTPQPPRLKHHQIKVDHVRIGKIACFKYSAPWGTGDTSNLDAASQIHGFSPLPAKSGMNVDKGDLSVICKPKSDLWKGTRGTNKLVHALGSNWEEGAASTRQDDMQENYAVRQLVVTLKVDSDALRRVTSDSSEAAQPDKFGSAEEGGVSPRSVTLSEQADASSRPAIYAANVSGRGSDSRTDRNLSQANEVSAPESEITERTELQLEPRPGTALDDMSVHEIPKESEDTEGRTPSARRGRGGRGRGRGRGGASASALKPWRCEKCGGTWKNDIGLKYHLEKAKVPCNPSFDPHAPKSSRKLKAKVAFDDALESLNTLPETHTQGTREEDKPAQAEKREMALPPPRSDKEKKRGMGCSKKVESSRRLKPLPKSSHNKGAASAASTCALLSQGDSQRVRVVDIVESALHSDALRPNIHPVGRSHRAAHGSPLKVSGSNNSRTAGIVKDENEISNNNGEQKYPTELPTSAATIRGMSQTAWGRERYRRMENLLNSILTENQGYFPGGEALWYALRIAWVKEYSHENCPTNRQFKGIFDAMVRDKVAGEHGHAFKAPNGTFATVKIVSFPNEDPFSPKAREMLDKIKAVYPGIWLPEHIKNAESESMSLRVNGELVRSKRALPNELVELDAPVYAEQLAAKRRWQEERTKEGYVTRGRAKRQKATHGLRGRRGKRGHPAGLYKFRTMSSQHTPIEVQRMGNFAQNGNLTFLKPNTALDDDDSKSLVEEALASEFLKKEQLRISRKAAAKSQLFSRYGLHQQSHIAVHEDSSNSIRVVPPYSLSVLESGQWPALTPDFFEQCGGSFTLKPAWFPDHDWFTWNSINSAIDRTASAQASRGWFRLNETDNTQRRFKDRLVGAARVEMAWGDAFLTARPGAAGPHNIFVHFYAPNVPNPEQIKTLSWPPDGQYSPSYLGALGDEPDSELSTDHDSEFEEAVSVKLRRRKTYVRGRGRGRGSDSGSVRAGYQRPQSQHYQRRGLRTTLKFVELRKRGLTSLPENTVQSAREWDSWDVPAPSNPEEILAGIVAVRSLMGGVDRHIDWGFLCQLFPDVGLDVIRKYWKQVRKVQKSYIMQLTRSFQRAYIAACLADELPMLDFDNPRDYDWSKLLEWTMQIPSRSDTQMPSTREEMNESFTLQDVAASSDSWRERFFHFQTSAFARLELAAAFPGAVSVDGPPQASIDVDIEEKSRSWIRSLCCTGEVDYAPEDVKTKLLTLADGDAVKAKMYLSKAIAQLTSAKVIHSKRGPGVFDSKPYRLMEPYLANVGRLANWDKYKQASEFKHQLDRAFRAGRKYDVPYTVSDGAMMALLNLHAHGRVSLEGHGVPHIPFGFIPGNYESRKLKKELYHFSVRISPTDIYQFTEDIPAVSEARSSEPPSEGPGGSLPQWVDFFGRYDINRWTEILGAVCFAYSTRGHMPIETVCQHMRPILEQFEARLLIDWCKRTGVLEDSLGCVTVGEWWWLAVPVMKQHPAF